jgi:hypothetical protein
MINVYRTGLWILAFCTCVTFAGCSNSNEGFVKGTVKAEGQPLAGALVEFYPKAGGGAARGRTNADGTYELILSRDNKALPIGEYEVRISTAGATEGGDYGKPSKETLPAKYNVASELLTTVNSGRNTIDFELDYKGKIIQPQSGRY